jgi:hypothetical protein
VRSEWGLLREPDAGVYFEPPAVRQAWWCSKLIPTATPSRHTRGLTPANRMIRATRAGGGKLTRTPTRGEAVPLERTCEEGCGGVGGTSQWWWRGRPEVVHNCQHRRARPHALLGARRARLSVRVSSVGQYQLRVTTRGNASPPPLHSGLTTPNAATVQTKKTQFQFHVLCAHVDGAQTGGKWRQTPKLLA